MPELLSTGTAPGLVVMLGQPGDTYCIKLSPARVVADRLERDPVSILLRTYDVYDNVHMGRIVTAWHRINREVDPSNDLQTLFGNYLNQAIQDPALRGQLAAEGRRIFVPRQHKLRLLEIEPSAPLGGTLDFSRERIHRNIEMGHDDALTALVNSNMITPAERVFLITNFRLPEDP
ncbi:MAG: hypothetical protein ACREXW_00885 [Gammaproteobacteria bacterium]